MKELYLGGNNQKNIRGNELNSHKRLEKGNRLKKKLYLSSNKYKIRKHLNKNKRMKLIEKKDKKITLKKLNRSERNKYKERRTSGGNSVKNKTKTITISGSSLKGVKNRDF